MGMAKYDRLLYILNLLRTRKNLNAARLAEECGVTERTIYRDIISLSEANIPIYYDKGYKYASDNFLPPLNFNIDEYLALKTALESSPLYKSGFSRKLMKSIKTKIEACLTPAVKREKIYFPDTMDVSIKATHAPNVSEAFFAAVEAGIKQNRTLKLKYNSIQSGITEREVDPYFLIFIERAFYFVGYCHLRDGLRTFRIDRIVEIEQTENSFIPRQGVNPAQYFKDSWGVYGGEPIDVVLRFTGQAARVVSMGKHHPNEEIEIQKDNSVLYKVRVSGIEEISHWIMGFGGEAEVLEPPALIEKIKSAADAIRKNYK
jgi:predicted DNA-binding transcriptional regulator YafY